MKAFKKILTVILVFVMMIIILQYYKLNITSVNSNTTYRSPIKAGVLLYNFNDPFISLLKEQLENIEKENPDKIKFTFFDGKDNKAIQEQLLDSLIQDNFDILLLNAFELKEQSIDATIYKINQSNIPLVLFGSITEDPNILKNLQKFVILKTNLDASGIEQGKIIVDLWNTNKEAIDKNGDNILQYIMLKGKINSPTAIARTKYSISAINNAGIETNELSQVTCNWDKDLAKNAINSLFLRYSNRIEAILSNNDAMAIGAIEALQKYGYNIGDSSKFITVVGIDAIPEAQELIKKGFMTGSVFQDPQALAEAIYLVGMNLFLGTNPVEGTNYTFDPNTSSVTVNQQYKPYTINSISKFNKK